MARELTMPKLSDSMADAVIVALAEVAGRGVRARRGADRGRDRQGDRGLRGRVRTACSRRSSSRRAGRPRVGRADRDAGERRRRGERRGDPTAPAATPALAAGRERGRRTLACRRRRGSRPNATPVARRAAVELGVSLHGIAGTGPGRPDDASRTSRAAAGLGATAPEQPDGLRGRARSRRRRADADAGDDRAPDGRVGDHDPRLRPSTADVDMSLIVGAAARGAARPATRSRRSTTSSSRPCALTLRELPRFNALVRRRARRDATRASTSASRSRPTTRCSCPSSLDADRKTLAADRRRDARGSPTRPVAARCTPEELARRHVHGLEPRHVRRALVHGDRRPAAGGDPRRRRRTARAGRRPPPAASRSAT